MRPADGNRVERLYRQLLSLEPAERALALAKISSADPDLGAALELQLGMPEPPRDPADEPDVPELVSLEHLLAELKRRSVFRVAAVYGALGFGVMQAADVMFPRVNLPEWTITLVVWLIILGFPMALVLAWAFETTPTGVRRTRRLPSAVLDEIVDQPIRHRWPIGLAGLAGGILLLLGAWMAVNRDAVEASLAVFPFGASAAGESLPPDGTDEHPFKIAVVAASSSKENDMAEGLVNLLASGLDDVSGLRSAPANLVLRKWRARDAGAADSAAALDMALSVGAHAAIVLSAPAIGSPLRIHARVYPVTTGNLEGGSVQVEGGADDLIELIDEIAVKLVAMLAPAEMGRSTSIAAISTSSLPAMRAFILGEQAMRGNALREAIPFFRRAVQEDSTFALAWHRLQTAYGWTGEWDLFFEAGQHAERHADQLPAREELIVRASSDLSSSGGRLSEVEDAVRVNPGDWELLEVLSEMYLHDAWRAGISPGVADSVRALAAAAAPENSNLLYHGIDLALGFVREPALADERIAEMELLGEGNARLHRLQRDLVFGTGDAARQDSILDALPDADFTGFPYPLAHPLSTSARDRVNRAIAGRDHVVWAKLEPEYYTHLTRGRLGDALRALAMSDTTLLALHNSPRSKACHAYMLLIAGVDLADTDARRWLSEARADPALSAEAMLCVGGRAVDERRWDEADRWIARLREAAAAGDSVDGPRADAAASALETYLRRSRDGSGDLILRSTRLETGAGESWPIRWWTARMLSEAGRKEQALEIYESFWFPAWVPAFLERAELSRELGRTGEARELYDVVLTVWAEADPAFRSLVERARAGRDQLGTPSM